MSPNITQATWIKILAALQRRSQTDQAEGEDRAQHPSRQRGEVPRPDVDGALWKEVEERTHGHRQDAGDHDDTGGDRRQPELLRHARQVLPPVGEERSHSA
jgi:hypothetical protein